MTAPVQVAYEQGGWVVRVLEPGREQTYLCSSEEQARRFEGLFHQPDRRQHRPPNHLEVHFWSWVTGARH